MCGMRLFFTQPKYIKSGRVVLTGGEARHMARSLRYSPGDRCRVTDGEGALYLVELDNVGTRRVEGKIVEHLSPPPDTLPRFTLGQGLPKAFKLEFIIEKATELGAHELYPLWVHRCQGKIPTQRLSSRLLRWQRVAREAAKQAGRVRPLGINPPSDLEHFVRATREADLKLTLWEGERERLLRHLLAAAGSVRWVSILVGPEGGLSAEEVELAAGKGYLAVNLGPRIMRTETAALAVLAILQHRWGGMG